MPVAPDPDPDAVLSAALRDAGLRVTSQRLILHRVLRDLDRHVSADELLRTAADGLPGLSLPTVYATLELLERLGLVRRISGAAGADLFDPRTEPHGHFVCDGCAIVVDVAAPVDVTTARRAARRAGLDVARVDVLLRGRCAACR